MKRCPRDGKILDLAVEKRTDDKQYGRMFLYCTCGYEEDT